MLRLASWWWIAVSMIHALVVRFNILTSGVRSHLMVGLTSLHQIPLPP